MHYSMHQAVKGRNETRFVFLASSIDPLFLFTLYSICPLTLVSIYDDCIHEHDIFYCIDATFVCFTFNVCYVNRQNFQWRSLEKNLLHNILHIPLQIILTQHVILFAPDYVINEPFLSLICTDQLKYVRDELIWHGRRKEMH